MLQIPVKEQGRPSCVRMEAQLPQKGINIY